MRPATLTLMGVLSWGCSTQGGQTASSASPESAPSAPRPSAEPDDGGVARVYGSADMKFKPCVSRVGSTLVGRDCLASILVYGPYVDVPARSRITFSFDVQGPTMLGVFSDMTARVATKPLGSLTPLRIPAGEKRHIEYGVKVEEAETTVEARIWLHGRGPVDFNITNLTMSVR
jgi:hypothetical protein